jgi:hypothetical protein
MGTRTPRTVTRTTAERDKHPRAQNTFTTNLRQHIELRTESGNRPFGSSAFSAPLRLVVPYSARCGHKVAATIRARQIETTHDTEKRTSRNQAARISNRQIQRFNGGLLGAQNHK